MRLGQFLWFCSSLWWLISACPCYNGGNCVQQSKQRRCKCPDGYLGSSCELTGRQLGQETCYFALGNQTAYFYYTPKQATLHTINFTFCSKQTSPLLMFQTTQNVDGSISYPPPLYQIYKLNFDYNQCIKWYIHHISQKNSIGQMKKMIIGLRPIQKGQKVQYLMELPQIWHHMAGKKKERHSVVEQEEWIQASLEMVVDYYKPNLKNYDGIIVMGMAIFMLVMVIAAFLLFVRSRFTPPPIDNTPYQFLERVLEQDFRDHQRRLQLTRQRALREKQIRLGMLMPVQVWGEQDGLLQDNNCAICLLTLNGEVRITPCRHVYHRECIDEWFRSKQDCPICRRSLDPSLEVQKLIRRLLSNDY